MAEMGVAAHRVYKEHGETSTPPRKSAPSAGCKARWSCNRAPVARLNLSRALNPISSPDEIYVFTPEGRIVELPAGATPVDSRLCRTYRYRSCLRSARVDRQPYLLSQLLTSGQTVEIITAPGARPNAAWFNFVVSSKSSRAKIRQLLKNLKRDDSVSLLLVQPCPRRQP